jgi:hypothetical protein
MIFILFFVIAFLYSLLIIWYWNGWKQTPHFQGEKIEYYAPLSIIVPYRNASSSLIQLLDYLETKNHLPFEVLLIDDFSEQVFNLSNEYSFSIQKLTLQVFNTSLTTHKNNKKEAIDYGVSQSKFPYILCTDSDVLPSENWLEGMMHFTQKHKPKFAAGIHQYLKKNSFLNYFLALEQDNYTSISCAGIAQNHPTMCNGANMIFEKSAYYDVGGYKGLFHINGGDDMLLLHRIQAKFPKNTHFIKSLETAVFSEAPSNLNALFAQRKRWLSKSFDYENKWVGFQMLLALLGNILFIVSIIFAFNQALFFIFPIWKIVVDTGFLISQKSFFKRKTKLIWLAISLLFYPFYAMYLSLDFLRSKLYHL